MADEKARNDVFISYSYDGEEHVRWVRSFADDLRKLTFDARDDEVVRPGDDLSDFMRDEIRESKFIICVCTEAYVEKFRSDDGSGVSLEGKIIRELLGKDDGTRPRVCPILRGGVTFGDLPPEIKKERGLDFSRDCEYWKNMDELYDAIAGIVRPVGKTNPLLSVLDARIRKKTDFERARFLSSEMEKEGVTFRLGENDGIYTIGKGEFTFMTEWSACGGDSVYAYRGQNDLIGWKDPDDSASAGVPVSAAFPALEDLWEYDYINEHACTVKKGGSVVYRNGRHHYAAIRINDVKYPGKDSENEVTFSYHVYGREEEIAYSMAHKKGPDEAQT